VQRSRSQADDARPAETSTGWFRHLETTVIDRENLLPRRRVLPLAMLVAVLVGWQLGIEAFDVSPLILPTPVAILEALVVAHEKILAQLLITFKEFALGFSLTVAFGYLLAFAMFQWTVAEELFYPYVIVARSIPVVTLLPVLIIWLGFGFKSIVAISFLISFFVMVVNSLVGFKSVDDELASMLESFSAGQRDLYRHVYLYGSLPHVFAGLKVAVILAFTGAIVGEFLIGTEGIGSQILVYNSQFDTAKMFASVLAISLTELSLFGIVVGLERWIVDWT
jgi:NitT/TauT family transport system permease protein